MDRDGRGAISWPTKRLSPMSVQWESGPLLQPIAEERPCGDNLEDTELLASFDTFRLFGQSRPLDAPAEPDEKRMPKPPDSPGWIGNSGQGARGARQEQGPARSRASRDRAAEDRRCAGILARRCASRPHGWRRTGARRYPLRRRGRDAAAQRAELLRRSDGRRRRAAARAARHAAVSTAPSVCATSTSRPSAGGRAMATTPG